MANVTYTAVRDFRWGSALIMEGRHLLYRRGEEIVLPPGAIPPPHCMDDNGQPTGGSNRVTLAMQRTLERAKKLKGAQEERIRIEKADEKFKADLIAENDDLKARIEALEAAAKPKHGKKISDPLS